MIEAPSLNQTIADNVQRVEAQIVAACHAAGRDRREVQLCAVTKTQPAGVVAAALEAGLTLFGENYVQETAKFADYPTATLHLIGGLQSNKVRKALVHCAAIQTLDRPSLADALTRELAANYPARLLPVFIEVNIAGEATKSGVGPEQLPELAGYVADNAPQLSIAGLMTIAPAGVAEPELRRCFARLRELRDELRGWLPTAHHCAELSMGMSDDFATAIAEGATVIRLGRALFGQRQSPLAPTRERGRG